MRITGVEPIARDLEKLAALLQSQRLQNKIGLAAERKIKTLTRAGKDFKGRTFPAAPTAEPGSPYSPGHRRRREKGHGSGKALQIHRKDLIFSEQGGMLEKIDHVVGRNLASVAIIIDDDRKSKIAGFLMAGAGRSKVKHEFFGLSKRSVSEIKTLVGREIDAYLSVTNLAE